jgi:hypothetical protein
MSTRSQVNRPYGTASEIAATALGDRELVVDITNQRLVLMDGVTLGGKPVAMVADVTAAIATTAIDDGPANFTLFSRCT